jgi:NAD(P)-dependent dehydrogenase (short-subunit alcohol dehydrogenase family)
MAKTLTPGMPSGQVLLITGASRGIGAATARLAGRAGYRVCVNYLHQEDQARAVVEEVISAGGQALAVRADVSEEAEVKRLFDITERELGPIRALVNNAGVTGGPATISTVTEEQITRAFRVNVLGCMLCLREAARRMAVSAGGRGGVIVNVSSTAARTTGAGEWVHYAAMKAAVDTLTRGAARELADQQIRVNGVAPGLILTDLHADNGMPDRPERLRLSVPMRRIGEPEEVAHAILWLLSDEASYVTGSVLEVSGGR